MRSQPAGLEPGVASASEITQNYPEPLRDPESYKVYVPAASKTGQYAHYTCEFDAAWAVMKTFGVDATLDQQIAAMGHDLAIEPYYLEPAGGVVITAATSTTTSRATTKRISWPAPGAGRCAKYSRRSTCRYAR